ncbi:MAG: glycoside hydrolase family 31 protein [Kiritimatiellae bacterium]|nr:glycoside hydrolase family 31 protein [Kiritimatiellia bacterium]
MRRLFATMTTVAALASCAGELKVPVLQGEGWWGGATSFGMKEPFGLNATAFSFDIRRENDGNQVAPLMLSTRGRFVWSEKAFACTITNGVMTFSGDAPIELAEEGGDLRSAFLAAARRHFPASGKTPDLALFAKPQWNTWVELTYFQNQQGILDYAKGIKENGFPVGGVIMVDDTWQHGYGVWDFDRRRFSDPKAMCDTLHADGYKVMLWVCPFVSMDSPGYREMVFGTLDAGRNCEKGGLIMTGERNVYGHDVAKTVFWWNGASAFVDFTHPLGVKWFSRELKRLQSEYGVDGFKLDAGDLDEYQAPYVTHVEASPSELCEAYARVGLEFPLNEYRACFKMGGQPLVQRLCDKGHDWPSVQRLVPDMIACGLLGHPFVCPDMIGGGSWMAFMPDAPTPLDQELFVRSAQVHALAPMMQFSAAPWRLLKGEFLDAVRAAANTRMKHVDYILETAKASAKSGEPMLRAMEYEFPGLGAERITDQFMLGSKLLVAPQTVKGARTRKVFVPTGTWVADDGTEVVGPRTVDVATPISRLPHFVRR